MDIDFTCCDLQIVQFKHNGLWLHFRKITDFRVKLLLTWQRCQAESKPIEYRIPRNIGHQNLFWKELILAFGCHIWLPSCDLFNKGAGGILSLWHTHTHTHTHLRQYVLSFQCMQVMSVSLSTHVPVCLSVCVYVDRAVFSLTDRCTNYLSISLSTFSCLLPSIHTS